MKTLHAMAVGTAALLSTGVSLAQNANMMNAGVWGFGWMGGYGGIWAPFLLIILAVGFVAWVIQGKDK